MYSSTEKDSLPAAMTAVSIEPAGAELQDNLVFETQFPYVTADNEGEISVLKGSEETSVAAAKPSEDNDMKTNSSSQDNGKGIPPADIEDDV